MEIERRKLFVAPSAKPHANTRVRFSRRVVFALAGVVVAAPLLAASTRAAQQKGKTPLPRYVSLQTAETLRKLRGNALPELSPLAGGKPLPASLPSLPGARAQNVDSALTKIARVTKNPVKVASSKPQRFAQAFPRPLAPARISRARVATPRWVRYPLEFQLCGIGIGTRAVDKDRFNRIDRYGLFAVHGNPTAIVMPGAAASGGGAGGLGGGLPGMGAMPGMPGMPGMGVGMPAMPGMGAGMPGMGMPGSTTTTTTSTTTIQQTPPVAGAGLFPGSSNGSLPDWAAAIAVPIDANHVQWMYKRENYVMGFVVDRFGYVDAIIAAGTESPIARTQLEDPVHTVKLGDDLRKVVFRYGYPDTIEADPGPSRTFELRYEQSYNVVFTIRNNRVARIYIFGDPDFFNEQRRRQFRVAY